MTGLEGGVWCGILQGYRRVLGWLPVCLQAGPGQRDRAERSVSARLDAEGWCVADGAAGQLFGVEAQCHQCPVGDIDTEPDAVLRCAGEPEQRGRGCPVLIATLNCDCRLGVVTRTAWHTPPVPAGSSAPSGRSRVKPSSVICASTASHRWAWA